MDAPIVGTGGGLRYLSKISVPNMVCQELPFSCQAACARQILRDSGIELTEEELLARIGYLEGFGTTAEMTATVLNDLHPNLRYNGGAVADPVEAIELFLRRDPWIASLATDRGSIHAVIVEARDGEIIRVRDPWGPNGPGSTNGLGALIDFADFMNHWNMACNNAVFPVGRK